MGKRKSEVVDGALDSQLNKEHEYTGGTSSAAPIYRTSGELYRSLSCKCVLGTACLKTPD